MLLISAGNRLPKTSRLWTFERRNQSLAYCSPQHIMGNTQAQPQQQAHRKSITEEIQGDYNNENAPRTPVRQTHAPAAFDPRSPSAPRTPVAASAPAEDPRSPMHASRTPLKEVDTNSDKKEGRKSGKPRPFNFSVSAPAGAENTVE